MPISDIQAKQGSIQLEAEVTEKGEVREFQKFGTPGRVCTAKIKDESGECNLSLWNEQIDQINAGDKVKITDGYASEWQGQLQVTTGRNGTLEVISKSDSAPTEEKSDDTADTEPSDKSEKPDDMVKEEVIE